MRPPRHIVVALAIAALAGFAAPATAAPQSFVAVSNDGGGVHVVVKPKAITAGSVWEFEIVMDTHVTPLGDDLTKTTVLVDDGGRRYVPLAWQGDPPGGHHRKGVLRFSAPTESIKSFELQIQDMAGVKMRVFRWAIK